MGIWDKVLAVWAGSGITELSCACTVSERGAVSSSDSSLGVDHGLWSRVHLHTSSGSHEGRVEEGVPKGITFCPETPMGHRDPHSPAQELPFCRCLEKEGEALPGADPALHAYCPLLTLLYLFPSLPVPLHLQKQLQGLSLAVQAPASQVSLLLLPLCSSRLPGEGCGALINILCSILGFPCLRLFCSGNGAFSSASIVQTKCLQALSYVRHHIHWEGCCEEERVRARLGLGALHHSEKQLIPCGLGW